MKTYAGNTSALAKRPLLKSFQVLNGYRQFKIRGTNVLMWKAFWNTA